MKTIKQCLFVMGLQWVLLGVVILFENTPKDAIATGFVWLALLLPFGGYCYAVHQSSFMADSLLRLVRGFLIALLAAQMVLFSALAGCVFFALLGVPVRG